MVRPISEVIALHPDQICVGHTISPLPSLFSGIGPIEAGLILPCHACSNI